MLACNHPFSSFGPCCLYSRVKSIFLYTTNRMLAVISDRGLILNPAYMGVLFSIKIDSSCSYFFTSQSV